MVWRADCRWGAGAARPRPAPPAGESSGWRSSYSTSISSTACRAASLRGCGQHGQRIAHVARLFAFGNHHRPVVDDMAQQPFAGNVFCREHNYNAGTGLRGGRCRSCLPVRADTSPRSTAPCNIPGTCMSSTNSPVPSSFSCGIQPHCPFAHPAGRCLPRRQLPPIAERRRGQLNGALDLWVACAAAKIVSDGGLYFSGRGSRILRPAATSRLSIHRACRIRTARRPLRRRPTRTLRARGREAFSSGHRFAVHLGRVNVQARHAFPSTSTEQEPHTPSAQPSLTEVKRASSRKYSSRFLSAATVTAFWFSVNWNIAVTPSSCNAAISAADLSVVLVHLCVLRIPERLAAHGIEKLPSCSRTSTSRFSFCRKSRSFTAGLRKSNTCSSAAPRKMSCAQRSSTGGAKIEIAAVHLFQHGVIAVEAVGRDGDDVVSRPQAQDTSPA